MTAKEDVEYLMNEGIVLAKKMLSEHSEFYPYGVALNQKREVMNFGVSDGTENPDSQENIRVLKSEFSESAANGELLTTAIYYDVSITSDNGEAGDAIAIMLDHVENYSVVVFHPYKIHDHQLSFGKISAQKGESVIFKPKTVH